MPSDCLLTVSPTEPPWLKAMASTVSMLPENYGCDVLIAEPSSKPKLLGVQRKVFPTDLIASLHDGRLGNQILAMRPLDHAVIVFEGLPTWSLEGELINQANRRRHKSERRGAAKWADVDDSGPRLTRPACTRLLASIQLAGVSTMWVEDATAFKNLINDLAAWWAKPHHDSILPKPPKTPKDTAKTRSAIISARTAAALQVVPGVGPRAAQSIARKHRLELTATAAELLEIAGLGPKSVANLVDQFGRK